MREKRQYRNERDRKDKIKDLRPIDEMVVNKKREEIKMRQRDLKLI